MLSQTEFQHQTLHQINCLDATTGTDIGPADQGHNPNHVDIGVIATMTSTEAVPGHIIDIVDTIIEALHIAATVLITYAATHHTKDHPHTEVP